jgi:hypothetical protein
MDGITTNRESFYVTISRAKHHLTLYTPDKAALTELAQKTKAKENVSDYIPLFQVVSNHAQTSQTPIQFVPASGKHRDLAKRIGESVGERICQKLAANRQRLTTERPEADCPASASEPIGTANSADTPDLAAFASTLESHVEPLSEAIAGFLEQRDLIECAGDLAQAVTAVNCSLECLERATENRANLAATVDRLHAAVGTKARHLQFAQSSISNQFQHDSRTLAEPIDPIARVQSQASLQPSRIDYQQMWQHYSQGVQASHPAKLDYLVGQKAFEDGQSQKVVSLMLTAGSPYVAQIHQEQGKEKARTYVNQTAKAACRREQKQQLIRGAQKQKQLEL